MTRTILTGHAEWNGEELDFKVGDWAGGIGLLIRRSGSEDSVETGAGIWPTVAKAQAIADEAVKRLMDPKCSIIWTQVTET